MIRKYFALHVVNFLAQFATHVACPQILWRTRLTYTQN